MLASVLRVLLVAAILAACLIVALFVGLLLARMGYLGSCEAGECELVALVYVAPFLGLALYVATLVLLSISAARASPGK